MSIERADFVPAWWLRNGHAQTLWAALLRQVPTPRYTRQRLELNDGDFIDLDWSSSSAQHKPLIIILHGLEGCSRSPYVCGLVQHLNRHDMDCLVMNFRGCSGTPNRLTRTYHSGETSDLTLLVSWLATHWPQRPLYAVGFSLGGNVLLKYLGETAPTCRITRAATVCVPMRLEVCAERMRYGLSRIYLWRLLTLLKRKLRAKYRHRPAPINLEHIDSAHDFHSFDDAATAPLHGFEGASDYYARSSAAQFIAQINTSTLIIHASDDPFMSDAVLPPPTHLPPKVRIERAPHGGHVGFIAGSGALGLVPRYWIDHRLGRFLA